MRILHISDLHYGPKYKLKFDRMLIPFLDQIDELNDIRKIDFIVFTGDLVNTGTNIELFNEMNDSFIEPILNKIKLDKENFIICPGNHDMSEKNELPAITEYIDKISNVKELDEFVRIGDQQFDLSYEKSLKYLEFAKNFYKNDKIDKLYHTFKRKIDRRKIAFVSFHTAWRSHKGQRSNNTLLLPKKTILDAFKTVPEQELYISLMHHPIKDLKPFNSYEVEDIFYEKFHMNFSGHYHKKNQGVVCTHDIGMLAISSMATMSGSDGSTVGFSVVDIDIDTYDIEVRNYIYINVDNIFSNTSNINLKLPMNNEKTQQVNLIKTLREQYDTVLQESNSLLIDFDNTVERSFIDQFESPVLKNKSYYESLSNGKGAESFKIKA